MVVIFLITFVFFALFFAVFVVTTQAEKRQHRCACRAGEAVVRAFENRKNQKRAARLGNTSVKQYDPKTLDPKNLPVVHRHEGPTSIL